MQLLPSAVARKDEEERRSKAAERVQRKLGVAAPAGIAIATGSGGSGAVAGSGPASGLGGVDGGRDGGGR